MRGEEYYETEAVSELEEDSPGEWTATVEGTESYSVEISMDGKEIESWYCDCPYDGEICKHVVATLLAIRDNEKKVNRSAFSKMKVEVAVVIDETVDIQQLLSFVNPQELSQFIYEYASMHPEFKTLLLNRFMAKELSATSKEKDYRAEIQKVFNDSYYNKKFRYHNRYDDFACDWEAVFNRMDTFLEKADFFLNVGNIDTAIDIALQTLRSIGENYEAEIYVNERDNEHLFKLLSSTRYHQLEALMKYSYYLKDTHSEQLIVIYTSLLNDYAEQNVGRTHYELIVQALLCAKKLNGGQAAVKTLVAEFRIKYKRRPAMMEVLARF